MARRKLNDEELQGIAEKDWKQTPIYTSDEKLANKAKNLTGPKTAEGKRKALANLNVGRNKGEASFVRHGGYINRILDEEEQEFYKQRREVYMKDYDLNPSSDETTLHIVLMEEVKLFRLHKKEFENPSMDLSRPIDDCNRRLRTAMEDLGTLRKQRLKQDDKVASVNIATIAQQFAREMMQGSIEEERQKLAEEEEKFLLEKKSFDINDGYEVGDDNDDE